MINLIVVGKLKEKSLISLSQEYVKRIQPYHKLIVTELKDFSNNSNIDAVYKESELILKHIKDGDTVVVLDLKGKDISSEQLSERFNDQFIQGHSNFVFIVGGSLGLHETVIKRANFRWKLSNLTFTHQFVRIIVLEQIYRSFKILANEPYHK